jgi:hypothetical protein
MDTDLTTRKAEAIKEWKEAMAELAVEYYKANAINRSQPVIELAFWFADWGDHWEWRSTVPQSAWKMISGDCKAFDRATSAGDCLIRIMVALGEISPFTSKVKLSVKLACIKDSEIYRVTNLSMEGR